MSESLNYPSEKAGLPPGTLVHVGRELAAEGRITLINFSADHFEERTVQSIEEVLRSQDDGGLIWVHFEGLAIIEMMEAIGHNTSGSIPWYSKISSTRTSGRSSKNSTSIFLLCSKP